MEVDFLLQVSISLFQPRIDDCLAILQSLLSTPELPFDRNLRGSLPNEPGLYRIYEEGSDWGKSLRVGRTKSAGEGLRQRVYQNHYMGSQPGNIRAQLIEGGRCPNLASAKDYLRERCR